MTVPLDRLYHYIESIAQDIRGDDVIIYRFYPHGAKKLDDLSCLRKYSEVNIVTMPQIYCNDQEPLDHEYYNQARVNSSFKELLLKYNLPPPNRNFQKGFTIYDKCLLLHSEKRSTEISQYENSRYIGVYYWSHAIIAMDWFRYARYDSINKDSITKKFLVYNRAWSGTREYRLKLVDLLIESELISDCQISVNPIEPELNIHYSTYKYNSPHWQPNNILEDHVPSKEVLSSASADYEITDYNATDFELVLETLFEDNRLHLTEKILRPIALGQPFLLAATHGSLEYLRSYGFKTFATVVDETYDTIEDPVLRLEAIVKAMKKITLWSADQRKEKLALANQIAEYNRNHFFSSNFNNQVIDELRINLKSALTELEETNTCLGFVDHRKKSVKYPELKEAVLNRISNRQAATKILSRARYYYNKQLK